MRVSVIREEGLTEALFGMGLSYGITSKMNMEDLTPEITERLLDRANRLAPCDGGHNKLLESIMVWLDVDAPREWWQQFDTYRIGVTKQSESTMHTLTKRMLTLDDFEDGVDQRAVEVVNEYIGLQDWKRAKKNLPEGFRQRRIVVTSYKVLRSIVMQRATHRLPEWHSFVKSLEDQLRFPGWLRGTLND